MGDYMAKKSKRMYRELTLREKILLFIGVLWGLVLLVIAISYYTIK